MKSGRSMGKAVYLLVRNSTLLKLILASIAFIVVTIIIGIYANKVIYDYVLNPSSPSTGLGSIGFLETFLRYDGNRYLAIASHGYSADITNTAFFPLYPLIVKGLSVITSLPITTTLFVTSWIFTILSVIIIFFWLQFELKKRKSGLSPWAILGIIAIFPTSFYLVLGYNESLFLFLTVSTIFAYRKQHYWLAAVLAALSTATRIQGCAIMVLFIADYLLSKDWKNWKKLIPVVVAPAGILLYMVYLWHMFGNPFQFIVAQAGWGRLSGNIIKNLITSFTPPYLWFLPILALGLWAIYRYVGKSWFIYSLVFILLPLSSGRLDSLNRYMLSMPVLFLAIGLFLREKSSPARTLYIVTSVVLLSWNIVLFMNGYWVG